MSFPRQVRAMMLLVATPLGLIGCESLPELEQRLATMAFQPHIYIARPGDTIQSIAFRYEVDAAEIAAMNPQLLPTDNLAGQRIVVHRLQETVLAGSSTRQILDAETYRQPSVGNDTILAVPGSTTIAPAVPQSTMTPAAAAPINNLDYEQIKEIPASAIRAPGAALPHSGFIEEVVEDELDYTTLPQAGAGQIMTEPQRVISAEAGAGAATQWIWPTYGEVAREFAPGEAGGQGIDIAGVPGQQIKAVSGGTVVYAGRDVSGGDGKLIILRHDDGLMTTYSHARQLFVAEDDVVNTGDVIASLGANARNETVLRFEVRQNGNPLNPMRFLKN